LKLLSSFPRDRRKNRGKFDWSIYWGAKSLLRNSIDQLSYYAIDTGKGAVLGEKRLPSSGQA